MNRRPSSEAIHSWPADGFDGLARRQMDCESHEGAVVTHPDQRGAELLPVVVDMRDVLQARTVTGAGPGR